MNKILNFLINKIPYILINTRNFEFGKPHVEKFIPIPTKKIVLNLKNIFLPFRSETGYEASYKKIDFARRFSEHN